MIERRKTPRWRVIVYMCGEPQLTNDYTVEELASQWAADMRKLYRASGLAGIFVRKSTLSKASR